MKQEDTLQTAIKTYIDRGFGSMNKNDFEVFIFGQLLAMAEYKGKSNYELSLSLHVPESKIKRLRYESALRTSTKTETDYKNDVYSLLSKATLRGREKKIVFQVEDIMTKMYITSVLKKDGRIIDTSFNPELVVIHVDDFKFLAQNVYPKGEIEKLMNAAKNATKKEVGWSEIMGWVIEGTVSGLASGTISAVIDLTPAGILKSINNVIKHLSN